MPEQITLALPSKGAIADPTYSFLAECGLRIRKPNPRQYTGSLRGLPHVNLLFQRVKDVLYKVADGTAHIGITGYDVVCEYPHNDLVMIHPELGYGHCRLLVAVPEAWVDVEHMADLADVAVDLRENQGRNLRVATTYPHMTRQFFHANGIHHFTLVKAEGAIEAAPTIGYADIIVDLAQTGTTLRENHLRPILNGTIIESQACLVGNRTALQQNPAMMETIRILLETIDAALNGRQFSLVRVNIRGEDAESVARKVSQHEVTRGLLGPTISPIYSDDGIYQSNHWFTVTVTVRTTEILTAVDHLRSIGGQQIITSPVDFIFQAESPTYARLQQQLSTT
jgi:ATP phosphoribosyltransferase